MNKHYKQADKFLKKLKKQKQPNKVLVSQTLNEITAAMKETMPKYIQTKSGILINLHDVLA